MDQLQNAKDLQRKIEGWLKKDGPESVDQALMLAQVSATIAQADALARIAAKMENGTLNTINPFP